jgi:hypothetical protein
MDVLRERKVPKAVVWVGPCRHLQPARQCVCPTAMAVYKLPERC